MLERNRRAKSYARATPYALSVRWITGYSLARFQSHNRKRPNIYPCALISVADNQMCTSTGIIHILAHAILERVRGASIPLPARQRTLQTIWSEQPERERALNHPRRVQRNHLHAPRRLFRRGLIGAARLPAR